MKTEKIVSDLIKPLIVSGVYKDEMVALKDIVAELEGIASKDLHTVLSTIRNILGR